MSTVTASKEAVLAAYKKAPAATKTLLSSLFDKEIFEGKITDRVKSFEDACKLLKLDATKAISKTDTKDEAAYKKLKIIIRALNEDWTPDWNNSDEYKYILWWDMEKTKSNPGGFQLTRVACLNTSSNVSSRLCFKNEEIARFAAKQFLSLFKDFHTA